MSLYLFADNNQGTAENLGNYRLYNMKIEGDSEGVESGIDYVDCLIGDGASYIDTGMAIPSGYKVEVTFMSTVQKAEHISSDWCAIFGCSNAIGYTYDTPPYGMSVGLYSTYIAIKNNGQTNLQYANIKDTCYNKKYILSLVAGENNTNPSNILVFANNNLKQSGQINPHPFAHNYLKIYDFKIYNVEGTLIQHLRPCLDTEGVPCMYDEVTKQYFHNQGSGTFGYKKILRDFQPVLDSNGVPCLMDKVNKKYYYDKNGNLFGCAEQSEYKRVEYLEGDGNSYLNIGDWTFDMNTRVEVQVTAGTGNILCNTLTTGTFYIARIEQGSLRTMWNGDTLFEGGQWFGGNINKAIVSTSPTKTVITHEGTDYTSTGNITSFSANLNLQVFGQNAYATGAIKVHYLQIYQSDELVFDGIPVLDNEGTPCMYDLVTETFFYNQGTGTFSYGIEEDECPKANYVEYLKAPDVGNQIDTGITYDNTYSKIEFKFNTNNCNTSDEILRAGGDRNFWFWIYYGNIRFFNSDYYTFENGSNIDIDVTITSTECIINGTTYTYETPLNSVSQNMQLFSHSNWIKLYYFRVYDSEGNLIQDLHPSLDNDKIPCMYDTVSDSYFYSNGNDTFEHGKSIGYTPIKYIETNGTQYIDTGVVVNDNIYMDIDYRAVDKLHYIEDGLILRLDAIDNTRDGHNASSTVWEDLSGNGLDFNLTDVTVNDTTMAFNGTSSVGTLQNIELWRNIVNNTEQYTVEVCLKFSSGLSSYNPIISTNLGNVNVSSFVDTIQVGQQSVGVLMKNNEYGGQLFFTISCDANDIIYHVNTKLRETLDKGDYIYPPTTDAFWIGARLTGQYYRFTGELCSIRIYNKKLTDEERLYNHSSDVIRYGVVTDVSVIDTDRNYLMNDFYTDTTYKYKEINTTVEPNLTASEGATLTLGSTYMSYLSEEELEQATKNGWIIE